MKYQVVLQHSEEDCGAACLAAIAKYYGRSFKLSRIRQVMGTGRQGTNLLGLRRGAELLGFNARSVRVTPEILNKINLVPLPAIIHWKKRHWVVLYGQRGRKYIIADPAVGIRRLSKQELTEGWKNWVMLLPEPDPNRFYAQSDDRSDGLGQWLRRLWTYRGILVEAFLCALAVGLLSLASPFLIQILTDDVLIRGDRQLLTSVAIGVITIGLTRRGLSLVQKNLIAHFAQRLELGLILEFGQQVLQLPLIYYEARRSGEVVSRLRDIQEINRLVSRTVISLPSEFFVAGVSFSFMVLYSWKLTIVAVAIAIIMSLSTFVFFPILQQKTRNLLVLEAENQGVLVETFKGALTLKVTTAAPQFWEEFQSQFSRQANLAFGTTQIGIINNIFSSIIADIGSVVLLWFGSNLTISKELSIGQLLAFTSLHRNVIGLISSLIDVVDEIARIKAATIRLQEVTTATTETKDEAKKSWVTIPENSDITCTDITYSYPGRVDLLQNFSLQIPGGKVVAIVGRSGCGKSTLFKLIAGLYQLQSGNIRIERYNIQDVSLDCLRQQIVLVPQEAHFWSRSIIDNFRMGVPDCTLEEIVRACDLTGADEFISKLPDKYQTTLGEFGTNLSGGQRQRLAIARAIVNDPSILLLDEATSGLDPLSENQILHQLLEFRQGKTTILISHRPRVINLADWIVCLDRGMLLVEGTIEDLRSHSGEHIEFLNP